MQALPLTGNERFVLSADAILRDESHYQRKGLYFVFLSRANFLQCVDEVAFKLLLFFIHVSLVLTGRCNLFCRHCMAAFYPRPWLPLEQLSDILSNWAEGEFFLKLTGGKPALHLQFGEVLELATSHRFSVGLLTNLPLLSEKGIERICEAGKA